MTNAMMESGAILAMLREGAPKCRRGLTRWWDVLVASLVLVAGAAQAEVPPTVMEALGFPSFTSSSTREVAELQSDLAWIGIYDGEIDGRMSAETSSAAAAFLRGLGEGDRRLGPDSRAELARRARETSDGSSLGRVTSDWTGMSLLLPRASLRTPLLQGDPPLSVEYVGANSAGLSILLRRVDYPFNPGDWINEVVRMASEEESVEVVAAGAWQDWSFADMVGPDLRTLMAFQHGLRETRGVEIRFELSAMPYLQPLLRTILESTDLFDGPGVREAEVWPRLQNGDYPGGDSLPEWFRSMFASGSGSIVSYAGHILTNHHVVAGCTRLTVNGTEATLIGSDYRTDLALVQSEQFAGRTPVAFLPEEPGLGEQVYVMGYPLFSQSQSVNLTDGIISSTVGLQGNRDHIQITAPVQPGNSGGPVLVASGAQVAVVVAKASTYMAQENNAENIAWAIRASTARDFLSRYGVEPIVRRTSEGGRGDVADDARDWRQFTVRIECHGS